MAHSEWNYSSLDPKEDSLEFAECAPPRKHNMIRHTWPDWGTRIQPFFVRYWVYLVNVSLFICSVSLAAWSLSHRLLYEGACPTCYVDDEQCTIHMSTISPVISSGAVTMKWQNLNGDPNLTSIYRGPPTYEREEAWEALESQTIFNLPEAYLPGLEKNELEKKMRLPQTSDAGYAAYLEVRHQLHCLGSLRRWVYKDEYVAQMIDLPDVFRAPISEVHHNLDFCIEMLRQTLMCNADTTPILLQEDSSSAEGYTADFSTKHKCRDYDSIVAWERDNRAVLTSASLV